ncbi:MAG: transposase family protein [Betaproteobacteria bacterium]|nr:transposase family protein [Betaproteobacteria bacterium]
MTRSGNSRRSKKQDARAVKTSHEIISGNVKVVFIERPKKKAQANRIGGTCPADEQEALAGNYVRLLRIIMPGILAELSSLDDPRDQRRITHPLSAIVLYGLLLFLCQIKSRREANRNIGGSQLSALMQELVPDFESIPHADTLDRLLEKTDVGGLEERYASLLSDFISSGKLKEINPGRFLVAADGTQKFSRDHNWDDHALSRNAGDPERERYFAYMMESVLILPNGMVLPLLTEILENGETLDGNGKQDCETKAFRRLAARLVKLLGKGCVTILLDGLYATGPTISLCESYGWEYMVTLKKESLASVWKQFNAFRKLNTENRLDVQYGDRRQVYSWANKIDYTYGGNNRRLVFNVVACTETWTEEYPRKNKQPKETTSDYAWLTSFEITGDNVFELCMKARRRWRIENYFHVAKHQNNYSHCYSYNWKAMKGYHYLMKFANFINALILHSQHTQDYVVAEGKKGTIEKAWSHILKKPIDHFNAKSVPSKVMKPRASSRCAIVRYGKLDLCVTA